MIDTMKITVTTPTLTPRIVNAERSLLARNVSSAMSADSLTSSNVITLIFSLRHLCVSLRLCGKTFLHRRGAEIRRGGAEKPSFSAEGFNRIELRGAPWG